MKAGMNRNDTANLLVLPTFVRAESFVEVQVRMSDLYIDSAQGMKAQSLFGWNGGGFQYRLVHDVPLGDSRFLPTFW